MGHPVIVKKVVAESGGYAARINKLADYITTPQNEDEDVKCLKYDALNFLSDQFATQKAEMRALIAAYRGVRDLEKRDLVQHWIMSWNSREMPETDDVIDAAKRFLDEMGFGDHQAFIGVHLDTENIHVHMAFSRVCPTGDRLATRSDDTWRCHAVMAGIEHAMKAEPNRNAIFAYNAREGVTPNRNYRPRTKDGRRMSKTFAYGSPESVVVELPAGMEDPRIESMRRKGDCWYFKGMPDSPGAVMKDGKLYFSNWAYQDVMDDINGLMSRGAKAHVQEELAYVFCQKKAKSEIDMTQPKSLERDYEIPPNLVLRKRPPTFPMEFHELKRKHSPWNFYRKAKIRYENKAIPPIRIHSMIAMHMRLHSFTRKDIMDCLMRDGFDIDRARHLTRWLYSTQGNMELFRQCAQRAIVPEERGMLKKPEERKSKKKDERFSKRLYKDAYGNLIMGDGKPGKDKGIDAAIRELDARRTEPNPLPGPFRDSKAKQEMKLK